jgi:hypothetical protein
MFADLIEVSALFGISSSGQRTDDVEDISVIQVAIFEDPL